MPGIQGGFRVRALSVRESLSLRVRVLEVREFKN